MKGKISALIAVCLIFALISCGADKKDKIKKPPESPLGSDGVVTVMIDPGHGFRDVGCSSEYLAGLDEHQLTMDFALRLCQKLEGLGYNVILCHDGENLPDMNEICRLAEELEISYDKSKVSPENGIFDAYERTVFANVKNKEQEIDLFLSIHVNASADSDTATGFELDYCAENASSEMSEFAFSELCKSIEAEYPERNFKQFADSWDMSFIVTKYTNMPSLLFETGFATTPSDATLLLDEEWRDNLMTAVAEGIEGYFSLPHENAN